MALGGGTFTTQNKILPGAYVNFISLNRARANLADRGTGTMPIELDWGKEGEVFTITAEDFAKNSLTLFGYDWGHDKLKGLRDYFQNAKTLHAYRLNKGTKAENTLATAKYTGERGNALSVSVGKNIDNEQAYDVATLLDGVPVDVQTVKTWDEIKPNSFVDWKESASLSISAGQPLTGGTNGTTTVQNYQSYLDAIESYSFNALGVVTENDQIKSLCVAFCKRMRDEVGAKFQTVVHNKAADFEGVINVKNAPALVWWATGLCAGMAVNKSATNTKYTGEHDIPANYTQNQLREALTSGEFVLHKVGGELRVLEDINSLTTWSETKGEIFRDNQTVRVLDQIAGDIATIFNTKYLGNVANDESGRISLWADIVKHHEELQKLRAIEKFSDKDVEVVQGDTKKSVSIVDRITVTGTMTQLYMVVRIA